MANLDMRNMQDHYPSRGDQVEAWIKDRRDQYVGNESGNDYDSGAWTALDNLLDEYRLASDTGQSLENMVNGEEELEPVDRPTRKKKRL